MGVEVDDLDELEKLSTSFQSQYLNLLCDVFFFFAFCLAMYVCFVCLVLNDASTLVGH